MDTGRFLLAVVLMIGVIIVTNLLFPPIPSQDPAVPADSVQVVDTAVPPAAGPDLGQAPAPAPPDADIDTVARVDAVPEADTVWVESELYRYGISTAGASLVSARLEQYKSFTREGPVELAVPDGPPLAAMSIQVGENALDLRRLIFVLDTAAAGGAESAVALRHSDPAGRFTVLVRYDFDPQHYLAHVRVEVSELGGEEILLLHLPSTLAINEIRPEEDHRALAYVVNGTRTGIRSVPLDDVDSRRVEEGPLTWIALKNKYFLVAALNDPGVEAPFGGLIAEPLAARYSAGLTATLTGRANVFSFRLYMGPQEYSRLSSIGDDLADVNPYGWKIFRPIIRPFAHMVLWALDGMHDVLGIGYGWVLILFGVLVRIALWPLNSKAMRSQLKTMELQPLLKEIQTKYKNEPEKLQREMVRLYKEEGFNPLGGCLPLLLPWPILITLFFVFQSTIAFRGQGFLWLPDLSQPDPLYILPLLMGASIFALQWLNLRVNPDPTPQMKMLTYFMPIMLVVLFLNFASGLNLYYATSNVASLPQQLQIMSERKKVRRRMA
ncbi:MAG TPA: membrane protein insertase YidC [Longimicrobiales bacterium]|nr:membrane protein insertase YidC [Longimicrobiales bacterium]